MANRDFKDLPKGTASDKALRDDAFNIAKIPKWWIPKKSCFTDVPMFW